MAEKITVERLQNHLVMVHGLEIGELIGHTVEDLRWLHRCVLLATLNGGIAGDDEGRKAKATVEAEMELDNKSIDELMPLVQAVVETLAEAELQPVALAFLSMLTRKVLETMGVELPTSVQEAEALAGHPLIPLKRLYKPKKGH